MEKTKLKAKHHFNHINKNGVPFSPNHQTLLKKKCTPFFNHFEENDVSDLKKY